MYSCLLLAFIGFTFFCALFGLPYSPAPVLRSSAESASQPPLQPFLMHHNHSYDVPASSVVSMPLGSTAHLVVRPIDIAEWAADASRIRRARTSAAAAAAATEQKAAAPDTSQRLCDDVDLNCRPSTTVTPQQASVEKAVEPERLRGTDAFGRSEQVELQGSASTGTGMLNHGTWVDGRIQPSPQNDRRQKPSAPGLFSINARTDECRRRTKLDVVGDAAKSFPLTATAAADAEDNNEKKLRMNEAPCDKVFERPPPFNPNCLVDNCTRL
jgi:hypothetical protein